MEDTPPTEIIKIARVCHEANRAWCEANGDHSQKSWDDAEDWQRIAAIRGVAEALQNPDADEGSTHQTWMDAKLADGWTYGEVKDGAKKTHPSLVPFDELPHVEQVKDRLFHAVVQATR